jgi:hypothetical protein
MSSSLTGKWRTRRTPSTRTKTSIAERLEPHPTSIPRLALRLPHEAAQALGVSADYFDEYVRHELRVVRRSRLVFVSVAELERWIEASGARTLEAL